MLCGWRWLIAEIGRTSSSTRTAEFSTRANYFLALLNKNNVIPSMSRKGNCYDNSIVESWFKSFKSEWLYRHDYKTEAELRTLVF
ncbi:MAG: transposase [Bdellovibrionales bacterium]|nr:transposase [Bdellovibrionales bacterium]